LHQTTPLLENAQKLNFEVLYSTKNLDPLQGLPHNLTQSLIHTKQVKNYTYGFMIASVQVLATGKNSLSCSKTRIWLPLAFEKNFNTEQNLSPVSERSTYTCDEISKLHI